MNDLPRSQQLLFDRLIGRGDVDMTTLYAALGGPSDKADFRDDRGRWYAQCWLSRYIGNLNKTLAARGSNLRVERGEKRKHYRLVSA